jgi:hypothetical protein
VLAPPLFSTIICWPHISESLWLTARAMTSVAPPAGSGTTSRTAFAG